jgi:hypothetical protein
VRTIFVLNRQDLAALKSGEPFEIQVGNNVTVTLQAERRGKRQPVRVPNARPIPTRRRTFSPKQKARILEDAKSGVSRAARVIDRWRRELAA